MSSISKSEKFYLSEEQAAVHKEKFEKLVEEGKLLQIAQKILSKKSRNIQNMFPPEHVVQQLCLEFLRPVKGQGMSKESQLHRIRLFNPDKSKFETYIYQCMSNLVLTMIDKANRKPPPVSYDNVINDSDSEENSFLNVLSTKSSNLKESDIHSAVDGFKKTLNKFELFVFDRIILERRKPKDVINIAEKQKKLRNSKRMYMRILKCRRSIPQKFIEYINQSDYFDYFIPESYAKTLV